jgi:hypothetical protein
MYELCLSELISHRRLTLQRLHARKSVRPWIRTARVGDVPSASRAGLRASGTQQAPVAGWRVHAHTRRAMWVRGARSCVSRRVRTATLGPAARESSQPAAALTPTRSRVAHMRYAPSRPPSFGEARTREYICRFAHSCTRALRPEPTGHHRERSVQWPRPMAWRQT